MKKFLAHYQFDPAKKLLLGVERECHLLDLDGQIKPMAPRVLAGIRERVNGRSHCYGYELSACQLEERLAEPSYFGNVSESLDLNEAELKAAEQELGFRRAFWGAAPAEMPWDVYPDPRYQAIVANWSRLRLQAACRVTGVHVLVGMPDHGAALRAYNLAADNFQTFCRMGDLSGGERLRLFRDHLIDVYDPPIYSDWEEFYERMRQDGFDQDPRLEWRGIRISTHGAIEFRMFDSTPDKELIMEWVRVCLNLCRRALS